MTNKFILDLGNQLHKFVLDAMRFTHKLKFDLRAYVNDDFRLNTFLSQEGKLVFFPKRKKKETDDEYCRCGHHTKDHSYNPDDLTGNLECDLCNCKNFEKQNPTAQEILEDLSRK